jgi:hypothetical protein
VTRRTSPVGLLPILHLTPSTVGFRSLQHSAAPCRLSHHRKHCPEHGSHRLLPEAHGFEGVPRVLVANLPDQ